MRDILVENTPRCGTLKVFPLFAMMMGEPAFVTRPEKAVERTTGDDGLIDFGKLRGADRTFPAPLLGRLLGTLALGLIWRGAWV